MNIAEFLQSNPEIAESLQLTVNVNELKDFADYLIEKGKKERKEPEPEVLLTPKELANKFNVSLVTLWHWDKRGLTKPVRIGNAKRYRLSDVEKILSNESEASI